MHTTVSDSLTAVSLSHRLCPWKVWLLEYQPEHDIYKIVQFGENMQQVLNEILAVVKKIMTLIESNVLHCRLVLGFHSLQTVAAAQVSRVLAYFILFFIANNAHHHLHGCWSLFLVKCLLNFLTVWGFNLIIWL